MEKLSVEDAFINKIKFRLFNGEKITPKQLRTECENNFVDFGKVSNKLTIGSPDILNQTNKQNIKNFVIGIVGEARFKKLQDEIVLSRVKKLSKTSAPKVKITGADEEGKKFALRRADKKRGRIRFLK